MKIIQIIPNTDGSRPALQDWNHKDLPRGFALCPDEFVAVFYGTSPAGFVNITVESDTVTEMTVNQEALDEYIATHPEQSIPASEPESESTIYDELALAYMEGVNSID